MALVPADKQTSYLTTLVQSKEFLYEYAKAHPVETALVVSTIGYYGLSLIGVGKVSAVVYPTFKPLLSPVIGQPLFHNYPTLKQLVSIIRDVVYLAKFAKVATCVAAGIESDKECTDFMWTLRAQGVRHARRAASGVAHAAYAMKDASYIAGNAVSHGARVAANATAHAASYSVSGASYVVKASVAATTKAARGVSNSTQSGYHWLVGGNGKINGGENNSKSSNSGTNNDINPESNGGERNNHG